MKDQLVCGRLLALAAVSWTLVVALGGCSDSSDSAPSAAAGLPQAATPLVTGPVAGGGGGDCCTVEVSGFPVDLTIDGLDYQPGSPFYTFLNYDMADVGYVEAEYFYSGTATS